MSDMKNAYCNFVDDDLVKINTSFKTMNISETIFAIILVLASFVSIWKAVSLVVSLVNRIN